MLMFEEAMVTVGCHVFVVVAGLVRSARQSSDWKAIPKQRQVRPLTKFDRKACYVENMEDMRPKG
jgi:hypothetical protein